MTDSQPITSPQADLRQEISRAFVHLLKEFYGKGPDRAKTIYSGDVVLVILRGGFTAVEKTLLDSGRGDAVVEQRVAFQNVMEERFREIVEHRTGRKVIAFIHGSHQGPDLIAQLFVLEPRSPDESAARALIGVSRRRAEASAGRR